ncbi:hypothetical protein FVEN_g12706 [Fusarium venenatum]|uniref:Uncharacterized protein n=1 Tax=Fusarium venenatum TaxID=56646 RepID=A0A2L2T981_9HYPO|nr:uncharacterized protein FVRRES_06247 [Fusarium venenatum]KAG8359404.1 hypothetical protein FVEN_g12706 [Fusarium venenatum]CEI61811.1 unnamed protein product [Fusarium venenatum]
MWKCYGRTVDKICDAVTDYTEFDCSKCGKRRAVNDEALSNGSHVIGRLFSVSSQGVETWEYYEPRPQKK